jgi:hypothetical protein
MTLKHLACLFLAAGAALFAQAQTSDDDLVKLARKLDQLTRVTEERFVIRAEYVDLCEPLRLRDHAALTGNDSASIHVFVTRAGAAAFKDSAARFPVGTVIFKQKFPTVDAKDPELYTGMIKRQTGFNPECGDWEFFTMNGDARAVTARGRIESCMDCHKDYAKTDFVTKGYR